LEKYGQTLTLPSSQDNQDPLTYLETLSFPTSGLDYLSLQKFITLFSVAATKVGVIFHSPGLSGMKNIGKNQPKRISKPLKKRRKTKKRTKRIKRRRKPKRKRSTKRIAQPKAVIRFKWFIRLEIK
jgi:hypothetical protein